MVKDNITVSLAQSTITLFFCSILTISVLRTHGYMNSPVKLDSCLHIRFSMSALKGEAAARGAVCDGRCWLRTCCCLLVAGVCQ